MSLVSWDHFPNTSNFPRGPGALPRAIYRQDVLTHQQGSSCTANNPWACEPSVPGVLACSWAHPASGTASFSFLSYRAVELVRLTGSALPEDRDGYRRAFRGKVGGRPGGGDLAGKGRPQMGWRGEFNFPEPLLCARHLYTAPHLSLIIFGGRCCYQPHCVDYTHFTDEEIKTN